MWQAEIGEVGLVEELGNDTFLFCGLITKHPQENAL